MIMKSDQRQTYYSLPSALARGIGSQSVARDGSECCMYVYIYMYVRHAFGMQLNFYVTS